MEQPRTRAKALVGPVRQTEGRARPSDRNVIAITELAWFRLYNSIESLENAMTRRGDPQSATSLSSPTLEIVNIVIVAGAALLLLAASAYVARAAEALTG